MKLVVLDAQRGRKWWFEKRNTKPSYTPVRSPADKAMANVRGLNANQESRRKNQVKLRLVKAIRAFSRAYAHAPMRKDTIPGCRLGTIPLFAHLQHRNIATSKTLNGVLDTIRSAVTDHSLPSRHRMQAAWQGRIAFLSWRTVCQM